MRITVFTPVYNRASLLPRLIESLKGQTFKDFEWVVVDDGSTDGTEELLRGFIEAGTPFPVVFKRIENGGKPNAVNLGVTLASGELFVTLDSDDYFTPDALESIDRAERSIPTSETSSYAGVCGLKGYADGRRIGQTFEGEYLDCTNLERIKNRILGDKSEAIYTRVMKEYPFPIFEGEKFITESIVLDRMAVNGLKFRYFNTVTMICEYRNDGLSSEGKGLFLKNPRGYGLYLYECGKNGRHGVGQKWRTYASYINDMNGTLGPNTVAEILHISPLTVKAAALALRIYRSLRKDKK